MAVVGDYRMTLNPFLRDKPELPTSPTAAAGARRRGAPEVKVAGRRSSICRVLPMALIETAPLDPCEQNNRYDFGGRHEDANLCRHCDAGLCLASPAGNRCYTTGRRNESQLHPRHVVGHFREGSSLIDSFEHQVSERCSSEAQRTGQQDVHGGVAPPPSSISLSVSYVNVEKVV